MAFTRILFAASIDPHNPYGGYTRPFYLAKYLSRLGEEVYVTSATSKNTESASFSVVRLHGLHLSWPVKYPLTAVELLLRAVKIRPDVVYAHTFAFGAPALLTRISKVAAAPLVLDAHGSWAMEQRGALAYWPSVFVERLAVTGADRIIAASEELRTFLVQTYNLDPSRVAFVPNGVDTEVFKPANYSARMYLRSTLGINDAPLIIFPAPRNFRFNVEAIKFMYSVMESMKNHGSNAVLLITGGGQIVGRPPPNVKYVGLVRDLSLYLSASDVGVLPYPSGSQSGGIKNKALEYFQCGLPVVSTREGMFGVAEAREGIHYLGANDDPEDFATKVNEGLHISREEREQIALRTVALVASSYTWRIQAMHLRDTLAQWTAER